MSIVCYTVEAGCKGSKCNKRRKNDEARNQDNDPLDKVEDMEAKKRKSPNQMKKARRRRREEENWRRSKRTDKEEQEPVGDVKDANLMEHSSPQRVRRAHKPQDTDSTDDEEHNELDFKNIKNQWNKNYVRNSLPKRMEEAMKSGSSRQKKHLNHKLSDEEVANEESEKLQLNLDDIHISKFGKLGPRGRERVLPLPTEDRELPMWRKNYKEESEE
uniref:Uncharacterized protein n=1 Tax=Ditylenchus dipsaci TaxID=166011 RepID=A0A915D040_9BILA